MLQPPPPHGFLDEFWLKIHTPNSCHLRMFCKVGSFWHSLASTSRQTDFKKNRNSWMNMVGIVPRFYSNYILSRWLYSNKTVFSSLKYIFLSVQFAYKKTRENVLALTAMQNGFYSINSPPMHIAAECKIMHCVPIYLQISKLMCLLRFTHIMFGMFNSINICTPVYRLEAVCKMGESMGS